MTNDSLIVLRAIQSMTREEVDGLAFVAMEKISGIDNPLDNDTGPSAIRGLKAIEKVTRAICDAMQDSLRQLSQD